MPKGVKTPPERVVAIIELLEKGVGYRTITDACGASMSLVSRCSEAMKCAKENAVPTGHAKSLSDEVLQRVYARYGNKWPPAAQDEPKKKTTAEDNTATAVVKLLGAITEMAEAVKAMTAAINQIDNRLSTMQMTQAGLRGDFGKEAQRIIEAIHVEGDIISKDQQKMIEHLDKIGHNTKRRPWQGEGAAS